ncbi:MAG: hypothetical protein MUC83_18380 [Pirellula sp.]|nr:hypothetical protein [Pirellula sp.]
MPNPYKPFSSGEGIEVNVTRFSILGSMFIWSLSFALPFIFQFLFLLLLGETKTSDLSLAILLFGPILIGFLGASVALVWARLSLGKLVAGITVTMIAFVLGFAVFIQCVNLFLVNLESH